MCERERESVCVCVRTNPLGRRLGWYARGCTPAECLLRTTTSQNVKRSRGGLVFKAHRWLYHSTVIKKKTKCAPFLLDVVSDDMRGVVHQSAVSLLRRQDRHAALEEQRLFIVYTSISRSVYRPHVHISVRRQDRNAALVERRVGQHRAAKRGALSRCRQGHSIPPTHLWQAARPPLSRNHCVCFA